MRDHLRTLTNRFQKLSIAARLAVIIVLAVVSSLIVGTMALLSQKEQMLQDRFDEVQFLVEAAQGILERHQERVEAGLIDQASAQAEAANEIKHLHFGDHGYFWINDMGPRMVMHPNKPELDGQDLSDVADPNGKRLFIAMVELVRAEGRGFVAYQWPHPDSDEVVDKISFVQGFAPWGWVIGTGIYLDDVDDAFWRSALTLLGEVLLISLVLVGVSIFTAHTILNQMGAGINDLVDVLRRLAAGDMKVRVPTHGGRPGNMANSINHMADNLDQLMRVFSLHSAGITVCASEIVKIRDAVSGDAGRAQAISDEVVDQNAILEQEIDSVVAAIGQANDNVSAISVAASQVSDNVHTIAAGTEEANANITTIASAAEQITANIGGVNQSLDQVDGSVQAVAVSVREMSAALARVREQCQSASTESEDANQNAIDSQAMMKELADAAREIGAVVEVINNIAEQTNMLSLNAAIEAAGAGEAGKGFAVVANEVKELARQTSDATRMIHDRAEAIQIKTQEAAEANNQITDSILRINQANSEITGSVDLQAHAIDGIAHSMQDVADAAGEVTRNARELNQAAEDVARAALEAATGTGEVARTSSEVAIAANDMAEQSRTAQEFAASILGSANKTRDASQAVGAKMAEAAITAGMSLDSAAQFQRMGEVLQDITGALFATQASLELGQPPFDIRRAKGFFLEWQSRLEQVISGRLTMQPDEVPDAERTPTGQWIQGEGGERFGTFPAFSELTETFRSVMTSARRIVETMAGQGVEGRHAALQELGAYMTGQRALFRLINLFYLEEMEARERQKPFFPWTNDLNTGLQVIDDDHRKLMDMVNRVHRAMKEGQGKEAIGAILEELAEYTVFHFSREADFFKQHGYPETEGHLQMHDRLVAKVQDLVSRFKSGEFAVAIDTLELARHWLIKHIKQTDMKYVPFLKSKGVD